jgi:hypothetical protein
VIRRITQAALVVALLVWVGHVWTALLYPLGSDASIFQYLAFLMDNGVVPYRDVAEMNTPGILILHWGVTQVIGLTDGAFIAFVMALCTCAIAAGLWHLRGRVSLLAMVVGLAVSLWAFVTITPWDRGQREMLGGLLLLGAFGLGGRAIAATTPLRTAAWGLAAGVVAGCAVTLKVTIIVVVWASWALWLMRVSRAKRGYRGVRHSVSAAFASLIGIFIPLGAVLLWLDVNTALGHFWHLQTTILPAHAGHMLVPFAAAMSKPLPLFLTALGIAAVASAPKGNGLRLLGVTHLAVVATYLVQRHGWVYHLHVSIPLVLPTVALLIDDWLPKARWAPVAALVVSGALLLKVGLVVGYDSGRGLHRAVQVGDHWNHESMQTVAAQISRGPRTDTVASNNDEHQLLLMAQRLPATPFLYGFLFSESHPDKGLAQLAMARVDIVRRTPPQWVVWNTRPYRPTLDSLEANPTFAAWLGARCDELRSMPAPYRVWHCPEF